MRFPKNIFFSTEQKIFCLRSRGSTETNYDLRFSLDVFWEVYFLSIFSFLLEEIAEKLLIWILIPLMNLARLTITKEKLDHFQNEKLRKYLKILWENSLGDEIFSDKKLLNDRSLSWLSWKLKSKCLGKQKNAMSQTFSDVRRACFQFTTPLLT